MRAHFACAAIMLAVFTISSAAQTTAQKKPPAAPAATKPGTLVVSVTDESGSTISGATVAFRGPADRQAVSGATGVATVANAPAGTHRVRISRDGFLTLEKEVTIKAGARLSIDAVLSAAPPPPPAPKPEPKPTPAAKAAGPVGQPAVHSVTDLADQMLRDKQPIVERDLGCSVATASKLVLVRENLAAHTHSDADEVLYLVAGEAVIKLGEKELQITPGVFVLVPRGTAHAVTKRGRNAPILLSVTSGPACAG